MRLSDAMAAIEGGEADVIDVTEIGRNTTDDPAGTAIADDYERQVALG